MEQVSCNHCNVEISKRSAYMTTNGKDGCRLCVSDCCLCGNMFFKNDMSRATVYGVYMCNTCYTGEIAL